MDLQAFVTENFGWVLIGSILLSQILLYAGRHPLHRVLESVGRSIAGALRLLGRWCRGASEKMSERARESLYEAGETELSEKIEREFVRLEEGFAKDLAAYPQLHQKLDESTTSLSNSLRESRASPPDVPGWSDAVQAVATIPEIKGAAGEKVLTEMRNMAVAAEKKALKDFRTATAKRHRILAGMAPDIKTIRGALGTTFKAVKAALDRTRRIDGFMDKYDKIRNRDDGAARMLGVDQVAVFLVSFLVTAIALGGAFVNFQLIALPMSELVPAGSRVMGVPVSTVAALVIVLMEAAAGIFVMEALGITELFPSMSRLSPGKRRLILGIGVVGLFLLAGIESSLAILREQIVAAEVELKRSLAGNTGVVETTALSSIPVIGQAVLGFILPWILAMVAIPLEMLISSGRHVVAQGMVAAVAGCGVLSRVVSHIVRYLTQTVVAFMDLYIGVPLLIERWVRRPPRATLPATEPGSRRGPRGQEASS